MGFIHILLLMASLMEVPGKIGTHWLDLRSKMIFYLYLLWDQAISMLKLGLGTVQIRKIDRMEGITKQHGVSLLKVVCHLFL
uniref:Putative secreted protein n=1 Tax=Xenopsylla cheopis TaxID=163159 RepID=A0A6M2DZU4_XENCH